MHKMAIVNIEEMHKWEKVEKRRRYVCCYIVGKGIIFVAVLANGGDEDGSI